MGGEGEDDGRQGRVVRLLAARKAAANKILLRILKNDTQIGGRGAIVIGQLARL